MADTTSILGRFLYGRLPQIGGGVSGTLAVSTTSASTIADTNETDLWSYSLPANTLSVDGRTVRVTVFGTTAANTNSKTVTLYFGGNAIRSGSTTTSSANWKFTADFVRTGSTAEIGDAVLTFGSAVNTSVNSSLAADTTAAIVIKVTGTNGIASAGDITFRAAIVELVGGGSPS